MRCGPKTLEPLEFSILPSLGSLYSLTLASAPLPAVFGPARRLGGGAAARRDSRFALRGGLSSGSGAAGSSPSALKSCLSSRAVLRLGQEERGPCAYGAGGSCSGNWNRVVIRGLALDSGLRFPALCPPLVASDPPHAPRAPGSAPFFYSA
jgi:hypothetical protein